ncbi:glycosyl hydrolase [Candidatus Heimdallarchaeota archaeon]|nr:MAG: glycosyl hydrolase [Candidatus Heimdallarchaeota archaeon]
MISNKKIEQKIDSLLNELTLDEKFKLMVGFFRFQTNTIKRLGIKTFKMTDGPLGIAQHSSMLRKNTRFAAGISLAASWNRELAYECGEAIAREARSINRLCVLGPGINIGRTPFCGRTYEYFSEDPYLTKEMSIPYVKGMQSQRVAACPKHYVANNQETNRLVVNANIDERTLHEIYLRAFKETVEEADPWTIMTSYNQVNGEYVHGSAKLLKSTLFEKWDFNGFVMTDWWATEHRDVDKGEPEQPTTTQAIKAGLSLEMPVPILYEEDILREEFGKGNFTEEDIDELIRRLLRIYYKVGMFEEEDNLPKGERNTKRHQNLARRMAEESIVLLKNENNILPINIEKTKKIAVLGPNLNKKLYSFLMGGAAAVNPPYEITPLKGLREKCKGKIKLTSDPATADYVLLFMGLNHESPAKLMGSKIKEMKEEYGNESENYDRIQLGLSETQINLIKKTVKINPQTIVILFNANPVAMEWLEDIPAVLEVWYPGMEGGKAIANVLFGDINPSGKIPWTFPKKIEDSPAHKSTRTFPGENLQVYYDEGIYVGYRYFEKEGIEPLFPFGYGLSYTSFELRDAKCDKDVLKSLGDSLHVMVKIKNTGRCEGSEVVQVYAQTHNSSVDRPIKELVGFQKVRLKPDEIKEIKVLIKAKDLAFYDIKTKNWKVDEGKITLHIGTSSDIIVFKSEITFKS